MLQYRFGQIVNSLVCPAELNESVVVLVSGEIYPDRIHRTVIEVEGLEVTTLYRSPALLVWSDVTRKNRPHVTVGGTCSTMWSQNGTDEGILTHS